VFPVCGLVFSFISITLGFTPAFLYITMLLQFNLPPAVTVFTNATLTMFSCLCSTSINFIFRYIPPGYALAGLICSAIGSIPGIYLQGYVHRLTGKAQYSMVGFNIVIFLCLTIVTAYQAWVLVQKQNNGLPLINHTAYCHS
jgi:uncharacterized membrane protein YfcA